MGVLFGRTLRWIVPQSLAKSFLPKNKKNKQKEALWTYTTFITPLALHDLFTVHFLHWIQSPSKLPEVFRWGERKSCVVVKTNHTRCIGGPGGGCQRQQRCVKLFRRQQSNQGCLLFCFLLFFFKSIHFLYCSIKKILISTKNNIFMQHCWTETQFQLNWSRWPYLNWSLQLKTTFLKTGLLFTFFKKNINK